MYNDYRYHDRYRYNDRRHYPCPDNSNMPDYPEQCPKLYDHGPEPYVVNIQDAAKQNYNFRLALWTGTYYQLTLMNIHAGEDIGLEMHSDVDQFLRIEEGQGRIMMGPSRNNLYYQEDVYSGYVAFVPAGTWHNLVNTGCSTIKLYSIYAPAEHPHGTVHRRKEDDPHFQGY